MRKKRNASIFKSIILRIRFLKCNTLGLVSNIWQLELIYRPSTIAIFCFIHSHMLPRSEIVKGCIITDGHSVRKNCTWLLLDKWSTKCRVRKMNIRLYHSLSWLRFYSHSNFCFSFSSERKWITTRKKSNSLRLK